MEETELDVGSASDELESPAAEPRLARRPTPRPFTIESLIGGAREARDASGGVTRDDRMNGSEEEDHRDREYQLYQRHYLATAAASTLPSGPCLSLLRYVSLLGKISMFEALLLSLLRSNLSRC